jgi:hypothetical protein
MHLRQILLGTGLLYFSCNYATLAQLAPESEDIPGHTDTETRRQTESLHTQLHSSVAHSFSGRPPIPASLCQSGLLC